MDNLAPVGDRVVEAEAQEGAFVARLRAGDDGAFEDLVRTHTGRLLRVARRLMPCEDDAREVVQEAFVAAFRALDGFKGDARLSTWLHRIVVNSALMKLRTRRRRPEEPIEALLPSFLEDGHHREQFRSWAEKADEALLRGHQRDEVRRAINQLPESYRTVLLLRDIEELETPVVAGMLGITPNAVKIRLHRARQALRTLLAPQFERV